MKSNIEESSLKESKLIDEFVLNVLRTLESEKSFKEGFEDLIFKEAVEPHSIIDFMNYIKPFIGSEINVKYGEFMNEIHFPEIENQLISMSFPPTYVLSLIKYDQTKNKRVSVSIFFGKVSNKYYISILNRKITKLYEPKRDDLSKDEVLMSGSK